MKGFKEIFTTFETSNAVIYNKAKEIIDSNITNYTEENTFKPTIFSDITDPTLLAEKIVSTIFFYILHEIGGKFDLDSLCHDEYRGNFEKQDINEFFAATWDSVTNHVHRHKNTLKKEYTNFTLIEICNYVSTRTLNMITFYGKMIALNISYDIRQDCLENAVDKYITDNDKALKKELPTATRGQLFDSIFKKVNSKRTQCATIVMKKNGDPEFHRFYP